MYDNDFYEYDIYMYLHLATLILYLIPAISILIYTKFKLDITALLNIALFTLSFVIKLAGAIVSVIDDLFTNEIIMGIISIGEFVSDFCVILNLYFFIFEMLIVYTKVTS